jgi:lysophospholipase L1-like esterase
MTRRRLHICLFLASLAALLALAATPAGARPAKAKAGSAKVAVGHPVIGESANGLASILVPVHYPIELTGRVVELRVALLGAGGKPVRSWTLHERLNSGKVRLPERRRSFTFVHRIGLRADLSRQLRAGGAVRVIASGKLDVDEDGKPELRSSDRATGKPLAGPRRKPVCSSIPHLRVKRGRRISVPLPVCDTQRDWAVGKGSRGKARVRHGRLIYNAPKQLRGSDEVQLVSNGLRQYARLTVDASSGLVVRALGDSVTAGFGYYANGEEMGVEEFALHCRPAEDHFNDACSSNSLGKVSKEGPVEYSPDYGLAKNVSWAAQWSNEHGVTNYKNFAISGSEPKNWIPAPEGEFYEKTKQIESEDPDYILLTLGANPLLSRLLTNPKDLWCAATSELPEFEQCIRKEFARVELRTNLKKVYAELLGKTKATIVVMQYHLSIPAIALLDESVEIAAANKLLNGEVAAAVGEAGNSRLQLVAPPHFNVGIDLRPVYPLGSGCRIKADGPSVQGSWTQDELWLFRLGEFCSGPVPAGPEWVIDGDTGIHPSATGYSQMASQVPAPR